MKLTNAPHYRHEVAPVSTWDMYAATDYEDDMVSILEVMYETNEHCAICDDFTTCRGGVCQFCDLLHTDISEFL